MERSRPGILLLLITVTLRDETRGERLFPGIVREGGGDIGMVQVGVVEDGMESELSTIPPRRNSPPRSKDKPEGSGMGEGSLVVERSGPTVIVEMLLVDY